ncbi:MAG: hypothetical protein WB762_06220 [Candidatus Sulfotelmatobacter sp.]
MDRPGIKEIRDELERLMREQIESLQEQTFLGISEKDLQAEKERLRCIREVSAEFLEALKKIPPEPT